MAHFLGQIQGQAGKSSRIGSIRSGIWSYARGWDFGVEVYGFVDENGEDTFRVFLTPGSNGRGSLKVLGEYRRSDLDEDHDYQIRLSRRR